MVGTDRIRLEIEEKNTENGKIELITKSTPTNSRKRPKIDGNLF